ncbi:hypothetical protein SAMN02745217_00186 [Anaerocolumna xylanovorans DSM 12503]|uniref:Uncharacterized protein n=1 Tax=Anaerocolumna xylanovorans DSM 12503 TaxID=1121345 RepID=A0A1M7XWZ5_9FIRM|nr:hypothetical protein SAMN02745217_00186 [Anaerocolumna xylanovorans DSM 12503]
MMYYKDKHMKKVIGRTQVIFAYIYEVSIEGFLMTLKWQKLWLAFLVE